MTTNSPSLHLDRHGWLVPSAGVRLVPSPNFNQRPANEEARLLIIHNISLPPNNFGGPYIEQLFTNQLQVPDHPFFQQIAHLRVSAHFLIRRTGEIIQFVSTQNKAWHAGISSFEGKAGCNDFSLGIELEGSDYVPFTDEQYCSLTALSALLRYHYPLRAVRGHEHIAPVRKTDPGPYFDWNRYRSEGKWSWRELPTLG
ncbi:1,6-anhydro-N-acetylmuramyl-L-alanine amidase AmpD [Pelistega sp. MC2]|uniref:1,6-anhydro-N-acetylmuramyl-L-alanine amidase AmpD n=1 Tax=Pelistega sp. MC2 TaxID=1720297 RepID=UPI0008DAA1E4|nr:1,6-anhydro-N-acetylmuramyl-L-alanine amidase AmpD [Pelistega sp. MC2]